MISLWIFVENWLSIYVWIYLYTLCSVPLIFLSILTSIPHCIDYYIDYLMSESVSLPTLIFIFKSILAIPGPLYFYMNFKISLSISTKIFSFWLKFHEIIRSIWEEFLTILDCPMHEHDTSLYLIGSFNAFHYHLVVLGAQILHIFVRFILKNFIFSSTQYILFKFSIIQSENTEIQLLLI